MTYIQANYKELGENLYNIMDDGDKGIVAYGMIPKPIMDIATRIMINKIVKDFIKKWKIKNPDKKLKDLIKASIKDDALNIFQHRLTVAILKAAHEKGGMIA